MEYEYLQKSYSYGLSKIYEMVINNDPCYAYLLECNQIVDQKLVMRSEEHTSELQSRLHLVCRLLLEKKKKKKKKKKNKIINSAKKDRLKTMYTKSTHT